MPAKKEKPTTAIRFKYPPLTAALKKLTPKERVAFIDMKFQNDLKRITRRLKGHPFEIIGTKKRPAGICISTNKKQLAELASLSYVDHNFIENAKATKDTRTKEKYLFGFKVIVQAQLEGRQKGRQMIDECIFLVKARDLEHAERKLTNHFKREENVYLNPFGQMVRWAFERIEKSYESFVVVGDDFEKPAEVYSELKARRLKKENIWNGD